MSVVEFLYYDNNLFKHCDIICYIVITTISNYFNIIYNIEYTKISKSALSLTFLYYYHYLF